MDERRPPPSPQRDWRRHAPAAVRDLRGGLRLLLDGVERVIDTAQATQQRLSAVRPSPLHANARPGSERRWPMYAWHGLRSSAELLGGGLDLALASVQASLLSPRIQREPEPNRPLRDAVVAALNAVAGDHLHRTDNPLAIPMQLQVRRATHPRLLILVHDLGMGAAQWCQRGHDHGEALAAACDATAVYVHFNSGRAVADNGLDLAMEIERVAAGWPMPIARVDLLGHGLGGLVVRSAVHQAERSGLEWASRVGALLLLGTPLQGGALPLGPRHWLQRATHLPTALARLSRRTSTGMADFAAGRYLPATMATATPQSGGAPAPSSAEPWPGPQAWHLIAGSIGDGCTDGVVPVASALARDAEGAVPPLHVPVDHCFIDRGSDHQALLSSRPAFERMRAWLAP
jgi:hypothetical protein